MIETSSDVCSVAVTRDGEIVALLENTSRDHSTQLAPMIKHAMQQADLSFADLSCVAVNGGPGSYTGLRIGLSTAKGLCYAASKPLIMVDALFAYANALVASKKSIEAETVIATVDNRRDELFYAAYDLQLNRLQDVTLTVATDEKVIERLGGNCIVVGSAVNKLAAISPPSRSLRYENVAASASNLLKPVARMFSEKLFADLAYSEPFYYKEVYIAAKTQPSSIK